VDAIVTGADHGVRRDGEAGTQATFATDHAGGDVEALRTVSVFSDFAELGHLFD
jgi:hypothetical protein